MKLRSFHTADGERGVCSGRGGNAANMGAEQPRATQGRAPDNPAALRDQEIGRRITVKVEDLPPPKTGPIAASRSMTLPYNGQTPRVPEGFTATAFAIGLEHPRRLLVLPNGDVLVAEQKVGYVSLLRDEDGDGKADWIERHIEGLNGPYGLAYRDGKVLVADQDGIWEVPHRVGALRPGRTSRRQGRRRAARTAQARHRWSAKRCSPRRACSASSRATPTAIWRSIRRPAGCSSASAPPATSASSPR